MSAMAATTAEPIRWVKETLPPRPLARWLLTTIRLSTISLAGMVRTEVAVGTRRLEVMLATVRAAAPRSRSTTGSGELAGHSTRDCGVSAYGAVAGCAEATGAVADGSGSRGVRGTACAGERIALGCGAMRSPAQAVPRTPREPD